MNVSIQTQVKYVLELTQSEAELLRGLMQNPLWGSPEDEPADLRELRLALFTNLQPKPPVYRVGGAV